MRKNNDFLCGKVLKHMRKNACLLMLIIMVFALSGCGTFSDDMLRVPELPSAQTALFDAAGHIKGEGCEYSAPRAGINRQPIQLIDLDGDGEEEGIVFLRDVVETYKTSIYILKRSGAGYSLSSQITGKENEIYTVAYAGLSDTGYRMIVEWGSGEGMHDVSVYGFEGGQMKPLLNTRILKYSVADIDGDGRNEFLAISEKNGRHIAGMYTSDGEKLQNAGETALSAADGKILGIRSGKYSGGKTGVFIEREDKDGAVTDIIDASNGTYSDITPQGIKRNTTALCDDINGDGVVEYPMSAEPSASTASANGMYSWHNFARGASAEASFLSYHSFAERWYLILPSSWNGAVKCERSVSGSGETVIRFYSREALGNKEDEEFHALLFTVYVLTGDLREEYAAKDGRFEIGRRGDAVFAAEIGSSSYLGTDITENSLKNSFKLRADTWLQDVLFA